MGNPKPIKIKKRDIFIPLLITFLIIIFYYIFSGEPNKSLYESRLRDKSDKEAIIIEENY